MQVSLWINPTTVLHPPRELCYSYLILLQHVFLLIVTIEYQSSIHNKHYLVRQAILSPRLSPWQPLFNHTDSSSFLLTAGLCHPVLRMMLFILYASSKLMSHRTHLVCKVGRKPLMLPFADLHWEHEDIKHLFLFFVACFACFKCRWKCVPSWTLLSLWHNG